MRWVARLWILARLLWILARLGRLPGLLLLLLTRLLGKLARLRQSLLLQLGRRRGLSVGLLRVIHGLAKEGLRNLLVGAGNIGARRLRLLVSPGGRRQRLLVSSRGPRQRRIGTERLRGVSQRRARLRLLLEWSLERKRRWS